MCGLNNVGISIGLLSIFQERFGEISAKMILQAIETVIQTIIEMRLKKSKESSVCENFEAID